MADGQRVEVRSVYRHANIIQNEDSTIVFTLPERVGYEYDDDITIHIVSDGERLYDIAQFHYKDTAIAPWDLWDMLAQFQPEPILDPSVPLPSNMEIYIPSADFIEDAFFGMSLAETPEI